MQCLRCHKLFSARSSLLRHQRESCPYRHDENIPQKKQKITPVQCDEGIKDEIINLPGPSNDNTNTIECPECNKKVLRNCLSGHIRSNAHKKILHTLDKCVERVNSAFKCRISSYRFTSTRHHIDHHEFFEEIKEKVFSVISSHIKQFRALKIHFELFSMYIIPEKDIFDLKSFNTKNKIVTISTDLPEIYNEFIRDIMEKASHMQEKDSGIFSNII